MLQKLSAIVGLIGIGMAGRLIPHLPNATPMTAITIAGSKHLGRAGAIGIPLITMVVSDALIGFYDWKVLLSVYGSFALIGVLSLVAKKYPARFPVAALVIVSPLIFFLVTNLIVWLCSPWFEKSVGGLLYCYELGLPFLRNMLIGDLIYTPLIMGLSSVDTAWIRAHYTRSLRMLRAVSDVPYAASARLPL